MSYRSASADAFKKRAVFSVHSVANKVTLLSNFLDDKVFTCVEFRSANIPDDFEDWYNWIWANGLLMTLKNLCIEQEQVTKESQKEWLD
ncbi:unnamed protein product [Absidia cylindrospora]